MNEGEYNMDQNDCASSTCNCIPAIGRRSFLVSAGAVSAGLAVGPVMAAEQRRNYSDLVKGHPALRGYWRFDGSLTDELGRQPAVEGPA
ncbi:hypothetical protein P4E94_18345, partial [Pontiellaceae bacterium B12219]|nr:hypothetical protein [Pontiellaceae bacterium B12219]